MAVSRLQRMHSAEHILTAVMRREFGSPRNLESHLSDKKSKCDYAVSQALLQEDILAIQRAVNAEIEKDYPITAKTLTVEEAQQDYDLWKVPENATRIRIVTIGDLDAIPCAGEHVEHTRQIGRFHVRSHDMTKEGIVRIRFTVED